MMESKKIIKVSFQHGYADMSRYLSKRLFTEYQIEINNKNCIECDYWIVYGNLPHGTEEAIVNPENVFLITTELDGYLSERFLKQFSKVITLDTHYKTNNLVYDSLGLPWFINKSFDELYDQKNVAKSKLLSMVVSNKSDISYTRNYKIRYDFAMAAAKYFGDKIDVFGRGFNELKQKEDGLYPYKFSIALENVPLYNGISEKIADCFLAHTFPLYWDCPNIEKYFSPQSYARLDIMDIDSSLQIIDRIISTTEYYEDHLNDLITAKVKYLEQYSFLALLTKVVNRHGNPHFSEEKVMVKKNNNLVSKIKINSLNKIYSFLSNF